MATPEQDYNRDVTVGRLVRLAMAGGAAAVGTVVWLYTEVSDMATARAEDAHDKAAMSRRIETVEIQARLHLAGEHEKTRRQRVKDVRETLKQFEAMSVELLNVVRPQKRNMVRRRLQEHRDRLTDSLIGD